VSLRDFLALMRVRLSQSKVGRWVTPRPIVVDVDLVTLGPEVRLRSHTTDISVLSELLIGNSYEPLPVGMPVEAVFDLGANTGLSFRWLRARWPDARFVCVEPEAGNLEVLRANTRLYADRVEVVGACVGGHERQVRIGGTDGEWAFRMVDPEGPSGEDEQLVDVVTMDGLLASTGVERIGVLKCDIEGAESELFADCRSWIGRVECLSVECHTDSMSGEQLVGALAENGAALSLRHLERNPEWGTEIATLVRSGAPPADRDTPPAVAHPPAST
jgi:FkbM family methyltransferase